MNDEQPRKPQDPFDLEYARDCLRIAVESGEETFAKTQAMRLARMIQKQMPHGHQPPFVSITMPAANAAEPRLGRFLAHDGNYYDAIEDPVTHRKNDDGDRLMADARDRINEARAQLAMAEQLAIARASKVATENAANFAKDQVGAANNQAKAAKSLDTHTKWLKWWTFALFVVTAMQVAATIYATSQTKTDGVHTTRAAH